MKVLITGAHGQLGTELTHILQKNRRDEIFPLSREEMDVVQDQSVAKMIEDIRPDVIIHTAAYTRVDQAETEQDQAFRINAIGTRNVAVASEKIGSKLVYISSDYIFDGKKKTPYTEMDPPSPLSVYGKSKLAGEMYVQSFSSRYFIVRTSWVYGPYGTNFVKTMLKLAQERNEVHVVDDQIGSPTYTFDLARCIQQMIETERYGIYHVSNAGSCSWYEFAKAIFAEAGVTVQVHPCKTLDFPRPAPRPAYSVLDHRALRWNGFAPLRSWQEALKEYMHSFYKGVAYIR